MAEETFHAHVLLVSPGAPDKDCGETRIAIIDGFAHFDHKGRTVSGSVADILPPNWKETGVTPIVRINHSLRA